MNDLLEAFGITKEDLQEEEKTAKDNKKQNKQKKKEVKSGKKSTLFKLPIMFCAGHMRKLFKSENEESWNEETLKKVLRKDFRELSGIYFKLSVLNIEQKEEGVNTYVKPECLYSEFTDEDKLEFPLEVIAGEDTLWVDTKITLEEIKALWVKDHPEYIKCKFQYDEKQKLLIPYFEADAPSGKLYDVPVTVGYLGITKVYEPSDFEDGEVITEEVIQKKYAEEYPEFADCGFMYLDDKNRLVPILKSGKKEDTNNIALPVEVKAGGLKLIVNPEDVKGKQSATLEELRKVLEEIYPEYSKERTEMIYDKRHFVIPILKSSRKGVVIISQDPEWGHEVIEDENHCKWRVETTPFGIFRCNLTKRTPVIFELKTQKIPGEFFYQIREIFIRNPKEEYAVQIFFDKEKEVYEIYEPVQRTTACTVLFERSREMEKNKVLVMDVHSHASMPAFFSSIDDQDEKGIRLYMVLGNLDKKAFSYVLRAGLAGMYGEVKLEDIFELEEKHVYKI